MQKSEWFAKKDFYGGKKEIASTLIYGNRDFDDFGISACIAIPTYHRPDLLEEALRSAVKQKTKNFEIIVVDNESAINQETDELMKRYAKKYPFISYYRNNANLGMVGNWNRCIELSNRKWTVMLHDDDLLEEDYLETVLPIAERSDCTLAGTFHYNYFRAKKEGKNEYAKGLSMAQKVFSKFRCGKAFLLRPEDLIKNILPSPVGVLLRTSKAIEFGGYDCTPAGEGIVDGKFHFNHICNGRAIIIPQVLSYKGIGDNDFLRIEMQKKIITDFYTYARHYAKKYCGYNSLRKITLDITVTYQAYGIKEKYVKEEKNKKEIDDLLASLGVSKIIRKLNKRILFLLTCLSLSNLIFRKDAAGWGRI